MALDQLTDQEKDILLHLSYVDLPEDRDFKGKSIEAIWDYAKYELNESNERSTILNDFFTSPDFKHSNLNGVTLEAYENNNPLPEDYVGRERGSESGFVGYAFKDEHGNGVAMYRGSETGNMDHLLTDWVSNAQAGVGYTIEQQREADAFYQRHLSSMEGSVLLLGHSKGNNLVSFVVVNNLDDKNLTGFTVNGAPLYWWDLTDEQKQALHDRMEFIVYEGDIVSQLGYVPYVDRTVPVKDVEDASLIYPHFLESVNGFNENGSYANAQSGATSEWLERNSWVSELMFNLSRSVHLSHAAFLVVQDATVAVFDAAARGLEAAATFIRDQAIKAIQGIQTLGKAAIDRIKGFFNDVIDYGKGLIAGIASWFKAGSAAAAEPLIRVDTGRLLYYAERLQNLKRRTGHLNDMIDGLYWEAGILGFTHVLQADISTSFDFRIAQSVSYLNNTAERLQRAERQIAQQAHSLRI